MSVTSESSNHQPSHDRITLLLFKDNHAARTFQVSLSWLSRLGLIAGTLLTITLISFGFALKYYYIASQADLSRVHSLEHQLADLKGTQPSSETKKPTSNDFSAFLKSFTGDSTESETGTVPVPFLKDNFSKPTSPPSTTPAGTSGFLFGTLLPSQVLPPPSQIPINLEAIKTSWEGATLKINFSIHYASDDKGSQQGTIVLIAHGPRYLIGHPLEIFSDAQSSTLISPEKGEHFSVSRFREVQAQFGPVSTPAALKKIEILIFSEEGKLLIHQSVQTEENPGSP